MLAVAALRCVGIADVAAGTVAWPAGAVIPAARVLRNIAADRSLVTDLRRRHHFRALCEQIVLQLDEGVIHDFGERGHGTDLDTVATIAAEDADSAQFFDAAQVDNRLRLPDSILEPVETVEPSGQDPGIRSVLLEKLLRISHGTRLIELESGHYVSDDSHNFPHLSIKHGPSNMGHQWMLHGPARFERRQNRVGVHRRTLEDFVPQRIRERIQDGSASTCNRRFAHTARPYRRLWIRNVQSGPLHVD